MMPIDFQCIYHGCPINDFMTFIIGSTDTKFRELHLEDLKFLYYDTFVKFLKYFNVDSRDFLSKTEFERIFEDRKDFYVLVALLNFPFLFASEDQPLDLNIEVMCDESIHCNTIIVKRFTEILKDFGDY